MAYLRRQFKTIAVILVPLAIVVFVTSTEVVKPLISDGARLTYGSAGLSQAQSGLFRTLAFIGAIRGDRGQPTALGNSQAGGADRFGQVVTDTEAHMSAPTGVDESVGESGRIGSGHHLDGLRVDGELRQGHGKQLDVIGGGVGPGVAGTKDRGQRFAGGVEERHQRMVTEPPLVGWCRAGLVRMRGDQGAVEVDDIEAGIGSRFPHLLAGRRPRHGDPLQHSRVDSLECAPRRWR